jgi:GxxExxY protein
MPHTMVGAEHPAFMNHRDTEAQREELNQLSHRVIGLCMEVHRELGPGLLESAYEEALAYELTQAGLASERQRETPLTYKNVKLNCGYRIDFIIEGKLILELKAVAELLPIHEAQVLTYLKLEHLITWTARQLQCACAQERNPPGSSRRSIQG